MDAAGFDIAGIVSAFESVVAVQVSSTTAHAGRALLARGARIGIVARRVISQHRERAAKTFQAYSGKAGVGG